MIKLAITNLNQPFSEEKIKKEAEALPSIFREKNSAYIDDILTKKHRPSVLRSIMALRLLSAMIPPLPLARTEYGKPYLKDCQEIDFSISHSNSLVICAVGQSPVGVDCEEIYKKDPRPMAERFFANGEKEYLKASPDKKLAFTEIWTKKESYIKYLGTGLSIPLTSFDTTEPMPVRFETFEHSGNIITVCASPELFPIEKNIG